MSQDHGANDAEELVKLLDDHPVYLAVHSGGVSVEFEDEIAVRRPSLEPVLEGLAAFATKLSGRFDDAGASQVSIQFGCQIAVESGSLVAVLGKASVSSTIQVGLVWDKPPKS